MGTLARWGRFIAFEGDLSQEDHEQMVEQLIAGLPDMEAKQQELRAQLINILGRVDPVDLLARASLSYLLMDPDSYVESEIDRSPAHIEYLALQVLEVGLSSPGEADPVSAYRLTSESIHLVRTLFELASRKITLTGVAAQRERPDDQSIEHSWRAKIHSLGIRGMGYEEHTSRIIRGCLDPFDSDCRRVMGFTAVEAIALARGISSLIAQRMNSRGPQAAAIGSELLTQYKRERRGRKVEKRLFSDEDLRLPWSAIQVAIQLRVEAWMFAEARAIALITPDQLAEHCSIDIMACQAFLDAFTCSEGEYNPEHHAYPVGVHPLTARPILQVENAYLTPAPTSLPDAIRPRMEDLIAQDQKLWERYAAARGIYVEHEATALLGGALPGSRTWNNIEWSSRSDGSDLDGLVSADDVTIRVQCKAGRMTAPARRGSSDRIKRNLRDLVKDAANQHNALKQALLDEGAAAIGFTAEQVIALSQPFQFEAVVTLDELTTWATETSRLRDLDILPADGALPWVVCLADLMAIVDLLSGAQLIHYLIRRLRIERHGHVSAHDELDWVGHYITEGLHFDWILGEENPPDVLRLTSYTDPIDAWYFTRAGWRTNKAPKPEQPIPARLKAFLKRLERERPQHWTTASIALLDGDEESRSEWERALVRTKKTVMRQGWSNATQGFNGRLGITLWFDYRHAEEDVRRTLQVYCEKKARDTHQDLWIGIGESVTSSLFVTLIHDPGLDFAERLTT